MNLQSWLTQELNRRVGQGLPAYFTLSDYMQHCLYHPLYGYYATRPQIGHGDFTTAPEISQLFGEMVGLWLVQQILAAEAQQQTKPTTLKLVEAGPGRGLMMADALRVMRRLLDQATMARVKLAFLETSPILQAEQKQRLGDEHHWLHDVKELNDWAKTQGSGPVWLVANEFLDVLPINQWRSLTPSKTKPMQSPHDNPDLWQATLIGLSDDGEALAYVAPPLDAERTYYWHEESASQQDFLQNTAMVLQEYGGAALFIDYGYEADGRGRNTLQALAGGKPIHPLATPGAADITAEVDFAHCQAILAQAGLSVAPLQSQAAWLTAMGLEARLQDLCRKAQQQGDSMAATKLQWGAARLMAPTAMGHLFKVMIAQWP